MEIAFYKSTCTLEPTVLMPLFTADDIAVVVPFTVAPIVPIRLLTKLLHAVTMDKYIYMYIRN